MTIEAAIKFLERDDWRNICDALCDLWKSNELNEALDMAISALHSQQREEENEPLTADELDSLAKQPIYFVPLDGNGVKARWVIYNGFPISAKSPLDEGQIYIYYFRGDYGERWIAYRHPPKEEQHGD